MKSKQTTKDDYHIYTQVGTQWPTRRSKQIFETKLISLEDKETINHGVGLSSGTGLLYSKNIWMADTGASCQITNSDSGSALTKDASARMKNLKPSLDVSNNVMRTRKSIDIRVQIINSKTKQKMNIKMTNC